MSERPYFLRSGPVLFYHLILVSCGLTRIELGSVSVPVTPKRESALGLGGWLNRLASDEKIIRRRAIHNMTQMNYPLSN